jgi:hypothetical protein
VVAASFDSSLLPPVAAVRTFQRLRGGTAANGNGDGKSDLHLSPTALDRWLEMPVRAEARLIRRGASLPAGVSVGAVCMRR